LSPLSKPAVLRSSSGIGLAIVQKAVTSLGGVVRVELAMSAGSTFIVTLPRRSYVEE
jgi:signal transduction histidine kinase